MKRYFYSILVVLSSYCSTTTFAEKPMICEIDVVVIPSSKFQTPTKQGTSIKNDGFPMLMIGIDIQNSTAMDASQKINKDQKYCIDLIGKKKDVYLSGPHNQITIQNGDCLKLKNMHSSGQAWPYWPDFYFILP